MKILTVNFLTCAIKKCKSSPLSFPLHFKDAELVVERGDETKTEKGPRTTGEDTGGITGRDGGNGDGDSKGQEEFNEGFIRNILPRLDWEALRVTCAEVCKALYFVPFIHSRFIRFSR